MLLVKANVVPSTQIIVTLMMEALRSSETAVLARATRRNISENSILHSHCRENFKSYYFVLFLATAMFQTFGVELSVRVQPDVISNRSHFIPEQ
jgi:hypothetical protein